MHDIFDMQAASYGWKFINNKLPKAISNKLTRGSIRSLQIHCRRYDSTTLKQLSPIDYITRTWNEIPMELKRAKSLDSFKKAFIDAKIETYV